MNGTVQETIDWHTASPQQLDGCSGILMTRTGTIIDGRLKASPPHDGYQATRFTLDDTDRTLQGMQILSVDQRRPPILQPSIRTLTVLKG